MSKVLLTSEDYIKTNSGLDDNIWGKNLMPAIMEAQEMGLQTIIGTCLYQRLCSMVDDGSIVESENSAYKTLLDDYVQSYMLYKVISDLIPIIGVKLANIGVVVSNDEHIQNLTEDERNRIDTYYLYRADFYCKRLQEFLLNNKDLYPELDECTCSAMKANLDSAASTGLFLGGYRGRLIRDKKCC
jgi:hypothetical protein